MFGYLCADLSTLSESDKARYKAAYCGLCRALKERHGEISRMTLNYDMTFLVLLLSSLYEPEEQSGENKCLPHPIEGRAWCRTRMTDYAADMNVTLAYLKLLDDWQDDKSISAKIEAGLFKKAYERIKLRYPRQCKAITESLDKLHALEKENSDNVDEAARCFGTLMAEIFVIEENRWSPVLRAFGMALGQFVYIMDACMDLETDARRGRYNPFMSVKGEDNEKRFRDILCMILGECVYYFDILPLVQDVNILKNILCDGLWQEFNRKYKKEASNVSGPV